MENDSYNAYNMNEYHNQIIEKIKNSDFGNLYEKNQTIIQDNLRKYKIIHMEYGKYGKSEVISYRDGHLDNNNKHEIDNFYIIYISINGDCFGNYLSMYGAFVITYNYMGYVKLDWNDELFKEPFNKGLSTISEKILTKTILEDTISRNIILYFISKSNNFPQNCKVHEHHCRPGLDSITRYKIFNEGFKFKNIFVLQEEYIKAPIIEYLKLKQKRIDKVQKRIKEAQNKIEEEEKKKKLEEEEKQKQIEEEEKRRVALELDRVNFQNKIINELIKDTNNYINYNEAKLIISMIIYNNSKFFHFTKFFNNYINYNEATQVLNKFASENKIRVEDSINIFTEHIFDIANILKIEIYINKSNSNDDINIF